MVFQAIHLKDIGGTQINLGNGDGELYAAEGSYNFDFARLAVGGWYYTAKTDDLVVAGATDNNSGIYAMAEKEIFKDSTIFARFGVANEDDVATL